MVHVCEYILHGFYLVAQYLQVLFGGKNQRQRLLSSLGHERHNLLEGVRFPALTQVSERLERGVLLPLVIVCRTLPVYLVELVERYHLRCC